MLKKTMAIALILFLIGCAPLKTEIQEEMPKEIIPEEKPVVPKEPLKEKLRCNDGTFYDECSHQKPYYCWEGSIIKKASICGCLENQIAEQENCVSMFEITAEQKIFEYTLRGKEDSITMTLHKELNDFLSEIPRKYYCDPECPSNRELELRFIDNPEQKPYLKKLIWLIQEKSNDKEEQARIAISLVQGIPYSGSEVRRNALTGRYPYEVLYDNRGVCGEKSSLLAFLLRELGFGVATFHYPEERHMTVGIKCPIAFSYRNTGYCFIETTEPIIITYVPETYIDISSLSSDPEIIQIADGIEFDAREEFFDSMELKRINKLGLVLEPRDYASWRDLMKKYGIHVRGRLFYK